MHVLGTDDSCMFTIYFLGRAVLTFVKKGSSLRSPTFIKIQGPIFMFNILFIFVLFFTTFIVVIRAYICIYIRKLTVDTHFNFCYFFRFYL